MVVNRICQMYKPTWGVHTHTHTPGIPQDVMRDGDAGPVCANVVIRLQCLSRVEFNQPLVKLGRVVQYKLVDVEYPFGTQTIHHAQCGAREHGGFLNGCFLLAVWSLVILARERFSGDFACAANDLFTWFLWRQLRRSDSRHVASMASMQPPADGAVEEAQWSICKLKYFSVAAKGLSS